MCLWTIPAGEVPENVQAELKKKYDLDYHHLE